MLSLSTQLGGRALALTSSLLCHVGAVVMLGGHGPSAPTLAAPQLVPIELAVLAVEVDQPSLETSPARPSKHVGRAHAHTHSYPVDAQHALHPHDPALVHLPLSVASARPTFVLAMPVASVAPAPVSADAHANPKTEDRASARPSQTGSATTTPVASEHGVDTPARLLAGAPPPYPRAAADAALEADVPMEIVVDEHGRVRSARALVQVGYGLEQAALSAVRSYRFQPAVLHGRTTAVLMKWTMLFRLQ